MELSDIWNLRFGSPTWQPHKIVPPPIKSIKTGLRDRCVWCGENVRDVGDGFNLNWSTTGGDDRDSVSCAKAPASCKGSADSHFHFFEDDNYHSDAEALHFLGRTDPEHTDYDGVCSRAPHETFGELATALSEFEDENSDIFPHELSPPIRNRMGGVNLASLSKSKFVSDYGIGTMRHCSSDEGMCELSDTCHRHNPDWRCAQHANCRNALTCPDCGENMHNVEVKTTNPDRRKTYHIPPDAFHNSLLFSDGAPIDNDYRDADFSAHDEASEDEKMNRRLTADEYLKTKIDRDDDEYGEDWWEVINPVCKNEQCSNFNRRKTQ